MDFIEKEPKFKKGEMVVFKDCDEDDIILYRAEKVVKVIWRKGQWFYKTEQNDMEFREHHFATRKFLFSFSGRVFIPSIIHPWILLKESTLMVC